MTQEKKYFDEVAANGTTALVKGSSLSLLPFEVVLMIYFFFFRNNVLYCSLSYPNEISRGFIFCFFSHRSQRASDFFFFNLFLFCLFFVF